jgi:ribosomal protein S18 acetylase RimI-like enzyme
MPAGGLEQALDEAGIPSRVTYLAAGMTCREPHFRASTATFPGGGTFSGFEARNISGVGVNGAGGGPPSPAPGDRVLNRGTPGQGGEIDFELSPDVFAPGQSLVLTAVAGPGGGTSQAFRNTARLRPEQITIRSAEVPDAPAVLELWAQARSEHASTADRLEDVERLIADSPAALLVAERGGEIIGALIAAWDGWRGNLYRLVVREACRRQGIGIALAWAGEEYLLGCGARRVTALVAFGDETAGGFWDSAGYPQDREIGRRVRNL